jgi:hypothetical protein
MEIIQTKNIGLKQIFLHNQNWWKFYLKHSHLIRDSIITAVIKMLVCRTSVLGTMRYVCPKCFEEKYVSFTCKSRFCPSCGKKATDNWIKTKFNQLPDTKWQHITFTMPSLLWPFFWVNRYLQNRVPKIAADIILELAKEKGFLPGIFLAIHTFGRSINKNFHLHLSTTTGGLSLKDNIWKEGSFYHHPIKKRWRARVIDLFREEYKAGRLKLPPDLKQINNYISFNSWLQQFFDYDWVVYLQKPCKDMRRNVTYLGRYIKRPPIAETRIIDYDGKTVTFSFLDHYDDTHKSMKLLVVEFIKRLISHIPDKNFRVIRYYGFLATRVSKQLLPIVYEQLQIRKSMVKVNKSWRGMIIDIFGYDPLLCPRCKTQMIFAAFDQGMKISIDNAFHESIAKGIHPQRI